MNAPFSSPSQRSASSAESTNCTMEAPLVEVSQGAPAANADAVNTGTKYNPLLALALWMAIFFGAMALLVATS